MGKDIKKYPNLFKPLTIRNITLRNRIISSPHSDPSHFKEFNNVCVYTDEAVRYYGNIARGGAAIVNTGHLGVDPRFSLGSNKEYFYFGNEEDVHKVVLPNIRRISDQIHAYGALAGFELNHAGRYSNPINGDPLIGPCDMTIINKDFKEFDGKKVIGMDEAEIQKVSDYFAEAASIGKRGGFDVITVHAGHNWLLSEFMSPIDNKRTDEYGGSVENRARFPMMVFKKIREAIGDKMLISIRISASELVEGGITIPEVIEMINLFGQYVDIVQCSVGKLKEFPTTGFTMPVHYTSHGCNAYLAEQIKPHVNVIIETVGAINEPEMADELIATGKADLIAMARSFCADADWGVKAREGRPEDIRPCIRCNRCLAFGTIHSGVSPCTVNPYRVLHCLDKRDLMTESSKHTAVIGGGPAGMVAAFELANKGHFVDLYEKSSKLGGRLEFADHIDFKYDIMRYRKYLETQVRKADKIKVFLNTEANAEDIQKRQYDAVVVAIGADDFIPKIPGYDLPLVKSIGELFGHEEIAGDHVAIIGGGAVGCEAAVHLQRLGKRVELIEMGRELMAENKELPAERNFTLFYLKHDYDINDNTLKDNKENDRVSIHLNSKCVEIQSNSVIIEDKDGNREALNVDSAFFAAGFRINTAIRDKFADCAEQVVFIGDCNKVGSIFTCSSSALSAALMIK